MKWLSCNVNTTCLVLFKSASEVFSVCVCVNVDVVSHQMLAMYHACLLSQHGSNHYLIRDVGFL